VLKTKLKTVIIIIIITYFHWQARCQWTDTNRNTICKK